MFADGARAAMAGLALVLGACFDPTFRNPVCGEAGECPAGWSCAAGPGAACERADGPGPGEPDAAPCVQEWISLLTNGGFEAGRTTWGEDPADIAIIRENGPTLPVIAKEGTWATVMGGSDNRVQVLTQTVTLPPGTTRVRLEGWKCVVTDDPDATDDDVMKRELVRTNDEIDAIAAFPPWSNVGAPNPCRWEAFDDVATLTQAAPAQAVLRMFVKLDGALVTTFYLDGLDLQAFACPTATARGAAER